MRYVCEMIIIKESMKNKILEKYFRKNCGKKLARKECTH